MMLYCYTEWSPWPVSCSMSFRGNALCPTALNTDRGHSKYFGFAVLLARQQLRCGNAVFYIINKRLYRVYCISRGVILFDVAHPEVVLIYLEDFPISLPCLWNVVPMLLLPPQQLLVSPLCCPLSFQPFWPCQPCAWFHSSDVNFRSLVWPSCFVWLLNSFLSRRNSLSSFVISDGSSPSISLILDFFMSVTLLTLGPLSIISMTVLDQVPFLFNLAQGSFIIFDNRSYFSTF